MMLANTQIWSTQTTTAVRMRINDDGSFVLYDSSSNAVFSTGPAPIRVCTSLFPLFHSSKIITSFLFTQPTSWMTDIWSSIQNKQMNLVALYGTHDSAMSEINYVNIGRLGAGISKAQNWNVTNQIAKVKTVRQLPHPFLLTYSFCREVRGTLIFDQPLLGTMPPLLGFQMNITTRLIGVTSQEILLDPLVRAGKMCVQVCTSRSPPLSCLACLSPALDITFLIDVCYRSHLCHEPARIK